MAWICDENGENCEWFEDSPDYSSLGQTNPPAPLDNETAKFYRQQEIAGSGESPLAGMGPGAGSFDLTKVDPSGLDKLRNYGKELGTGKRPPADYMTLLAGVLGLYEAMNKKPGAQSWGGTLKKGAPVQQTVNPAYFEAVKARPYGGAAMGMNPFTAAEGGLAGFARGGKAMPPRYLRGETDGMEDKIPSNIDDVQPAKLSHGEFVIPADVVSHLGNGNSDAGAKVLYKMMDRVRHARTGTKKQGKRINPAKFTPGGIAGYADGGAVAFQTGGATGATSNLGAGAVSAVGGLAPWVGDYVAGPEGFLSKAWALGDKPYQAYQGPLTAGTSPLQQQAFQGLSGLGTPSQFGTATQLATQAGQAPGAYQAGQFGSQFAAPGAYQAGQFDTGLGKVGSVQDYMSPYMSGVTDIAARKARQESDIARKNLNAKFAGAGGSGAFSAMGGGRHAVESALMEQAAQQQLSDIQEKGLQSAYDRAMQQRMQESQLGLTAQQAGEQSRQFGAQQGMQGAQLGAQYGLAGQQAGEQSRQFGANLGLQGLQQQLGAAQTLGGLGQQQFGTQLQGLQALLGAGGQQQGAEQAAIEAQKQQFQEAQKYPYAQLEFQRQMLQGLPVGSSTTSQQTSMFSDLMGGVGGLLGLYKDLGKAGFGG